MGVFHSVLQYGKQHTAGACHPYLPFYVLLFLWLTPLSAQSIYNPAAGIDTNLTFTEVMFYAPSGNNEFVEIYNLSANSSINLAGYFIQYENNNPDGLRSTGKGTILAPHSYAVVFEGDYDSLNGVYQSLVPQNALILKINNNAFGSNGMANTSDRTLALLRPDSSIIETYTYSAQNNTAGISDEKIIISRSNQPGNWTNCYTALGTPGKKNTGTPPDYDLAIKSFTAATSFTAQGVRILLSAVIKNLGAATINNYILQIYNDANRDSIAGEGELLFQQGSFPLAYLDSAVIPYTFIAADSIPRFFIAVLSAPQDQNPLNNTSYTSSAGGGVLPLTKGLRINEIMYAPLNDEPEWIELINVSAHNISLNKIAIGDRNTSAQLHSGTTLAPGTFAIITKDSSLLHFYPWSFPVIISNLPQLNNDSDIITIRDSTLLTHDSVSYHSTWGGHSGHSLERIISDTLSTDSLNWLNCPNVSRATPGRVNAVSPKQHDVTVMTVNNIPTYAEAGSSFAITAIMLNKGSLPSGTITVRVLFDANNDGVPQPSETLTLTEIPSISPLAYSPLEISIPSGNVGVKRFFVHAAIDGDEDTENDFRSFIVPVIQLTLHAHDILINEFSANPETGTPEWIELYNNTPEPLSLQGMQIADAADTVTISKNTVILAASSFVVVSSDSTLARRYPGLHLLVAPLPVLNDNGDKIILLDSHSRTIDSLHYAAAWLGSKGTSLERVLPQGAGTDSANWRPCIAPGKATPGKINSVTPKNFDVMLQAVSGLPPYLQMGEHAVLYALVKNIGLQNNATGSVSLYLDGNNDNIPDNSELLQTKPLISLAPNTQDIIPFTVTGTQPGSYHYMVQVLTANDQELNNNIFGFHLQVISSGITRGSIVLNEFLCNPFPGKSEWIELYNTTDSVLNISRFAIADTRDTVHSTLNSILFPGNTYLVLARDSTFTHQYPGVPVQILPFPVLNNEGDKILFLDSLHRIIDSVSYSAAWLSAQGVSLERIAARGSSTDSSNWKLSPAQFPGTPGSINKASRKKHDLSIDHIALTPQFPESGDTVFINTLVKNTGDTAGAAYTLIIINQNSNAAIYQHSFEAGLSPGDSASITAGPFVFTDSLVHISAKISTFPEDDTTNNSALLIQRLTFASGTVLISEIMFAPASGAAEWVEIYNNTEQYIDLTGCSISDVLPSPKKGIIAEHTIVAPHGYTVISNTQGVGSLYGYAAFGALNNNADGICLYNNAGVLADRVDYNETWQKKADRSLERIALNKSSSEASNWHYSLSPEGASPFKENTASELSATDLSQVCISEIRCNPPENNSEFIELYNNESFARQIGGYHIRLQNGIGFTLSDTLFWLPGNTYFVYLSDTLSYQAFPHLGTYPYKTLAENGSFVLSNTGGSVVVENAFGKTIDSLLYFSGLYGNSSPPALHNSLERISFARATNDASNWGASPAATGATPAVQNAITIRMSGIAEGLTISPNPFSPDDDGLEDITEFRYSLPFTRAVINIRVFDDKGRLRKTLMQNAEMPGTGIITYDGREDSGTFLPLGMYIVLTEITDTATGQKKIYKQVLVSARKL